jgi:ribosome-associated protein
MGFTSDDEERDSAGDFERPSRSARKRAAEAAQDLGEELIRLKEYELDAIELPEELREAIREARRITSRAAGARQRQFIGRLMRLIDPAPIEAALAMRNKGGSARRR